MIKQFALVVVLFTTAKSLEGEDKPAEDSNALSQIEIAAAAIKEQVSWFGPQSSHKREFLLSVATMNYVQTRVSPFNYALRVNHGQKLPTTPEQYLQMKAGVCGGQVMTARAILTRLGIRNRPIEFYLHGKAPGKNSSHIGFETFYNDKWHFFDVTWGAFFRKSLAKTDQVLSIAEILKLKDPMKLAVVNESDLWYQQWTAAGHDAFIYLKSTGRDIVVDRGGVIRLRSINGKGQLYKPVHQPNYVGRSSLTHSGAITYQLLAPSPDSSTFTITLLGIAGSGRLIIQAGKQHTELPLDKLAAGSNELKLKVPSNVRSLQVRVEPVAPTQVGYVVLRQIELK